jgi:DNA-binding NarL/FixJ family response regulator
LNTQTESPFDTSRILIIEDHPIFRLGLKELIDQEPNLTVCGEADNVSSGLNAVSESNPDLVIVDINLQGRDRLDLIQTIKQQKPSLPVLVVSMYDETTYVERAMRKGASGYVVKHNALETVVNAIQNIFAGQTAISEPHKSNLLQKYMNPSFREINGGIMESLSDREMEVFLLIGKGNSTGQIAEVLNLSVKTIGTYREHIKKKLNLKNAAELLREAYHYKETQSKE